MVLTHKFFDGKVPAAQPLENPLDKELVEQLGAYPEKIGRAIETYRLREAAHEMMNLARLGNKYLTETEPWKLFKTDPTRTAMVLNLSLQICANLAIMAEPFLPFSSEKMKQMLQFDGNWQMAGSHTLLETGHELNKPELLFEQIDDATIQKQIDKLMETKRQNELNAWAPATPKAMVAFDDFGKLDIRVGTVLECTKVPKADKLLQFKIEDGMGTRTIVSGVAKFYPEPEKLVGQQVCFIANFAPRKLKGVESQGMILSAEDKDGRLVLITPSQLVTPGCNVG